MDSNMKAAEEEADRILAEALNNPMKEYDPKEDDPKFPINAGLSIEDEEYLGLRPMARPMTDKEIDESIKRSEARDW